jgi:hypothetical protein
MPTSSTSPRLISRSATDFVNLTTASWRLIAHKTRISSELKFFAMTGHSYPIEALEARGTPGDALRSLQDFRLGPLPRPVVHQSQGLAVAAAASEPHRAKRRPCAQSVTHSSQQREQMAGRAQRDDQVCRRLNPITRVGFPGTSVPVSSSPMCHHWLFEVGRTPDLPGSWRIRPIPLPRSRTSAGSTDLAP